MGKESCFNTFGSRYFNRIAHAHGLVQYKLKERTLRSQIPCICTEPEFVVPEYVGTDIIRERRARHVTDQGHRFQFHEWGNIFYKCNRAVEMPIVLCMGCNPIIKFYVQQSGRSEEHTSELQSPCNLV